MIGGRSKGWDWEVSDADGRLITVQGEYWMRPGGEGERGERGEGAWRDDGGVNKVR
jgi:hypothetical protein